MNSMKIQQSIDTLQLASKMSEQYYGKPLLISYSGGKDSDVLLQLAKDAKIPFEVQHSHTTVDAPETVYHIREVFEELKAEGINCYILHAKYKDGRRKTMWNLIEKRKMPPTRLVRYCCQQLKERSTPHRFIALGVRAEESVKRASRSVFENRVMKDKLKIQKSFDETQDAYDDAQTHDEVWDCKFIELAKKNKDLLCNPIIEWTNQDVWSYIKDRGIKYNPMYDKGFNRVGCIGCPMAPRREREKEFALYPQYKMNYIKAFDRMLSAYTTKKPTWKDAMDVFKWWMGDDTLDGQITWEEQ